MYPCSESSLALSGPYNSYNGDSVVRSEPNSDATAYPAVLVHHCIRPLGIHGVARFEAVSKYTRSSRSRVTLDTLCLPWHQCSAPDSCSHSEQMLPLVLVDLSKMNISCKE